MTVFFFASAAASSAYLTVSEIFPLEMRALAIAFFYAIGTAIGGIVGPLLFGMLIDTGSRVSVAIGYCIGSALMIAAAAAEASLGRCRRAQAARSCEPAAGIDRLKNGERTCEGDWIFWIAPWMPLDITVPPFVPDLRRCAILLDIDGTILDIAPSPRQVWVPAELRRTLVRLGELTGGAVALVSGRTINDIDLIFSPLAARRDRGSRRGNADQRRRRACKRGLTPLSKTLKRKLATIAELGPGILVEDKGYSLALHYRLAPEKGPAVLEAVG